MSYVDIFVKGTKDFVEHLYGSTITVSFPNYAKFWSDFVGNPNYRVPKSYGLLYKTNITEGERKTVNSIYEEICMAHYSLFCHLAGTHFQMHNLSKLRKSTKGMPKKYFEYWETFEVCYFHLGSAFYQMYHLWGLIFLLENRVTRRSDGSFSRSIKPLLKNYLSNAGQGLLCKEIDDLDGSIKVLRDNIVHFSREASDYVNGEFLIPAELEKKIWTKKHDTKNWLETSRLTKEHLMRTEKLIDAIHHYLIMEFKDFLTKRGIAVNL